MSDLERAITIASLSVVSVFYIVAIFFYLISDKTRLNLSLAVQKFIWFLIIAAIALPGYSRIGLWLPSYGRMLLWVSLTLVTFWVLVEVYYENRGRIRHRIDAILHTNGKWDGTERRNGLPGRRKTDFG